MSRIDEMVDKYLGEAKMPSKTVLQSGEYKSLVDFQGRKVMGTRTGKTEFAVIMQDGTVHTVTPKVFFSLNLPDKSSERQQQEYLLNLLAKVKQFNKKVDYNSWVKHTNPSFEEKVMKAIKL